MNGYLDRLVARTLGAQPAAAPRPRALFEDTPEAAPDARPRAGATHDRGVTAPSSPDAPAARAAVPVPAARAHTAAAATPSAPAASSSAPAPAEKRTAGGGTIERMPQPSGDGGAPHPIPAGDSPRDIAAARRSAAPESAAARDRDAAAYVEPARVRPAGVRSARAESAVARAQDQRSEPTAEPAPPDVVHVTIGRVDVRTSIVASPPPPPRAQPAERVLSLHDYLRGERAQ